MAKPSPIRKSPEASPPNTASGNTPSLTRREIREIYGGCMALGNVKASCRFAYAIAKTANQLEPVAKAINAAGEPAAEFAEFAQAHHELATEYAVIDDETGQPKIWQGQYVIQPDKRQEFERRVKRLQLQHAETIKAEESRRVAFEAFLDEAEPVSVHRVALSEVPSDVTPAQIGAIMAILDEDGD